MLELINSGRLSDSPVGRYLHTMKARFRGPVVADLLCYLRLYTELALRAKGILMMRENGFDVPIGRADASQVRRAALSRAEHRQDRAARDPADVPHEPQGPVAALHAGRLKSTGAIALRSSNGRVPGALLVNRCAALRRWLGRKDSNPRMPESKSGALTNLATPQRRNLCAANATCRPARRIRFPPHANAASGCRASVRATNPRMAGGLVSTAARASDSEAKGANTQLPEPVIRAYGECSPKLRSATAMSGNRATAIG